MSTELLVIVVGLVLMVLSVADTFRASSSELINTKLRVPMGVIGVMLIIYGGFSYGAINLQGQIEQPALGKAIEVALPVRKVQVLSPIEGDSVKCRILTMGVYPKSHKKDIWVLLLPSDNRYYPQSDHTNTSYKRGGEWQGIARFGGDKGESYELIVYETDADASAFFSNTIQAWKDQSSYPGLTRDELPKGASELERITVFLKDNCRGVN